jgi:simple sugar transport system ATP-binding protein
MTLGGLGEGLPPEPTPVPAAPPSSSEAPVSAASAAEHARHIDRSGEPIFELRGISHSYGRNEVIHGVDLSVWPGEVVALVGDNGAGKSTLLKIFAGYQRPTAGTIRFAGHDVRFGSPADARGLGVEAVYQDLAIIDQLSLWRNFFLGKELVRRAGPFHRLERARMRDICETALSELGLTRIRSADDPAWALSGGERQSVAITRAWHFGARVLLLDEPTAALSVRETRNVLSSIARARDAGLGILYIDHNMGHVLPVADRIVLLELGRVVRVIDRGEVSVSELQDLVAGTTRAALS